MGYVCYLPHGRQYSVCLVDYCSEWRSIDGLTKAAVDAMSFVAPGIEPLTRSYQLLHVSVNVSLMKICLKGFYDDDDSDDDDD